MVRRNARGIKRKKLPMCLHTGTWIGKNKLAVCCNAENCAK
ncbi:hypothetical protein CPter91_3988 [Collimonas pratensis]|uniref:Uncharacterized protein n=1 Tax=Collimonas pratensis TaxID=279113 RepID=A0A127Q8B2_9BURK|nr:hypothetical protein CPter91_3988 [Collimonas pratensis]